jgi:predicted RNase H-like HicB family nuclease
MKTKFNILYSFEDKWIVARCLEIDVVSQGRTMKSAERNIKQAIKLYIDSFGEPDIPNRKGKPVIRTVVISNYDKAASGIWQSVNKVSRKARISSYTSKRKSRILAKNDA